LLNNVNRIQQIHKMHYHHVCYLEHERHASHTSYIPLLPNDRRVPKEGHYASGMNKLIAEAIQKYLIENIKLYKTI